MSWSLVAALSMASLAIVTSSASAQRVCYRASVQGIGWQSTVCDGQRAGTTGQSRRLEQFQIFNPSIGVGSICYQPVAATNQVLPFKCGGATAGAAGTTLEAILIWLNDHPAGESVGTVYKVHMQSTGWSGLCFDNFRYCGGKGTGKRLEAFELNVQSPGFFPSWQF